MINHIPDRDINNKIVYQTPAFKDKATESGNLYRRKHGFSSNTIADGANETITLVVPYDNCKINEVEIVNAVEGVTIDFYVHDTPTGTISTIPSYMLNQFGFAVELPTGFYRDVSDYDASLIKDMEVRVKITNNTGSNYKLRGNIVWHEVKL
jgi:hypothetical protein